MATLVERTLFPVQIYIGENAVGEIGFADSVAPSEKTGEVGGNDFDGVYKLYDFYVRDTGDVYIGFGEFGGTKIAGVDNLDIVIKHPDVGGSDIAFTAAWDDTSNHYKVNSTATYTLFSNNVKNVLDVIITKA